MRTRRCHRHKHPTELSPFTQQKETETLTGNWVGNNSLPLGPVLFHLPALAPVVEKAKLWSFRAALGLLCTGHAFHLRSRAQGPGLVLWRVASRPLAVGGWKGQGARRQRPPDPTPHLPQASAPRRPRMEHSS